MNVFLKGYFGHKNFGDDAILLSIFRLLRNEGHEIKLVGRGAGIRELLGPGVSVVSDAKWYSIIVHPFYILLTDGVVIGGGGLFQHDSFFATAYKLYLVFIAKILRKKTLMVGVGVNPVNNQLTKLLWKIAVKCLDVAVMRDDSSHKNVLNAAGLKQSNKILTGADLVFCEDFVISHTDLDLAVIIPAMPWSGSELDSPRVQKRYKKLVNDFSIIVKTLQKSGYKKIIFLDFHDATDSILIKDIVKASNLDGDAFFEGRSFKETQDILFKADFVVGMRFHSIVFSIAMKKPMFAIAYDFKSENLLNECGMNDSYVRYGIRKSEFFKEEFDFNSVDLEKKLKSSLDNKALNQERAASCAKKMRRMAMANVDAIRKYF